MMRRIYNVIAWSLTAVLMACAPHPEPGIKVVTQEVKVPYAVPCVDGKSVPAEPAKIGGQLNGQAAHDLDLVSSSAIMLRQWGRELNALIGPCVKP